MGGDHMSKPRIAGYIVRDADRSWMDRAACRGADPELFHPERGDNLAVREAKAVCAECPVRARCLHYAVECREIYGVWGGASERERRRIRRDPIRVLMARIAAELEAELEAS